MTREPASAFHAAFGAELHAFEALMRRDAPEDDAKDTPVTVFDPTPSVAEDLEIGGGRETHGANDPVTFDDLDVACEGNWIVLFEEDPNTGEAVPGTLEVDCNGTQLEF